MASVLEKMIKMTQDEGLKVPFSVVKDPNDTVTAVSDSSAREKSFM